MPTGPEALNNPIWASLCGAHAEVSLGGALARTYRPSHARFAAMADPADPACWDALAELCATEEVELTDDGVILASTVLEVPDSFATTFRVQGIQMLADGVEAAPCADAVVLGAEDAAAMVELVERTEPGPFRPRTYELGTFVGIAPQGHLVAMAGQRFHLGETREISAVCTDPASRGQGLARALVGHLIDLERQRGSSSLLHVSTENAPAQALYRAMGFTERTTMEFAMVRPR